jgi:hypothetical protein
MCSMITRSITRRAARESEDHASDSSISLVNQTQGSSAGGLFLASLSLIDLMDMVSVRNDDACHGIVRRGLTY